MISRRVLLAAAGGSLIAVTARDAFRAAGAAELQSLTADAKPISPEERRARIARVQSFMERRKVGALLVEPGSTLEYFTGIRWPRSERTTLAIIPAHGEVLVVTPAFEEPSVRETLQVGGDVRPWNEQESPFERIVQGCATAVSPRGRWPSNPPSGSSSSTACARYRMPMTSFRPIRWCAPAG
jgi:Xaa-Pro dipeptidase